MKSPNQQETERGPTTLIRYEPAVEIYDSMRSYHLQKYSQEGATNLRRQEIIESIIPPRQWTDHANKLHIQYASHHPASRDDVVELTNTLDKMLIDRQARLKGICAIRQQLYSQTFDEMIRQVAVDCPQRGLLLMRVRDEHKMTLAAYQTVYQSSIGYGIQKQVESEEGTDHLEQEYSRLQAQKQGLEQRKMQLLCEKELLEKELKENKALESEQREEELHFLRVQTENMTKFLDSVRTEMRYP